MNVLETCSTTDVIFIVNDIYRVILQIFIQIFYIVNEMYFYIVNDISASLYFF